MAQDAMKKRVANIRRIFEAMKATRQNWDTTWRDVALYVSPNKDDVFKWKNKSKGEEKHERLYDGSAEHFNLLHASALHSLLTNQVSQWFDFSSGDDEIDKVPEVREYFQKLVRKLQGLLNNSNFQTELHEVYLDLGSFGTAPLRIEKDEDFVFRFLSSPIYEKFIKENHKKIVDTIASENVMTNRQALQKYGDKFGKENVRKLNEKPDDTIEILHIIMPRDDAKEISEFNKPFVSLHVWFKGDIILEEGGFDQFPYVVPRWSKMSGEVYGRSPGMKALPDIRMLNQQRKTVLRSAQKIVDPPLDYPDDAYYGRLNTRPGGLNARRSGTRDDGIRPILTGGNIPIGLEIMNETREQIKQHFLIDQLQLKDGPQMTATEVNVRDDDRIRIMGPLSGRLQFEFLQPMVARLISIMMDAGEMPDGLPVELEDRDDLKVIFVSQIAKAQRAAEAVNFQRFMGDIAPLFEAQPEKVLELIDVESFVNLIADIRGVPQEIFKKTEQKEQEQRSNEQGAAKAEGQQDALVASEVVKNASGLTELTPGV